MPCLFILAELVTLGFFVIFCLALASDDIRGPVFEIKVTNPVGRVLLRNAQIAFILGYDAFFGLTAAIALNIF